jgi:hypothetical protein
MSCISSSHYDDKTFLSTVSFVDEITLSNVSMALKEGDQVKFNKPGSLDISYGVFLRAERKTNGLWARIEVKNEYSGATSIVRSRLNSVRLSDA